jgi:hypothetical protein
MQFARHILTTALVATALLAGTAHAMPAQDAGHWTESASHAARASSSDLALVVTGRRGPLAV